MDKAERSELLRARYYSKHGKRPIVERIPKPQESTGKGWRNWSTNFVPFGEIARENDTQWIETPDPKKRIVPRTKGNIGVPTLTRVSTKAAPKKLKRRHANAESLLAERARR